jgi:hypothetical protein
MVILVGISLTTLLLLLQLLQLEVVGNPFHQDLWDTFIFLTCQSLQTSLSTMYSKLLQLHFYTNTRSLKRSRNNCLMYWWAPLSIFTDRLLKRCFLSQANSIMCLVGWEIYLKLFLVLSWWNHLKSTLGKCFLNSGCMNAQEYSWIGWLLTKIESFSKSLYVS